jgi:hypothetical protein
MSKSSIKFHLLKIDTTSTSDWAWGIAEWSEASCAGNRFDVMTVESQTTSRNPIEGKHMIDLTSSTVFGPRDYLERGVQPEHVSSSLATRPHAVSQ